MRATAQPTEREEANARRALRPLRSPPVAWRPVAGGGATPARRWIVTLEDGGTAFVKAAVDDLTASWIRDEHVNYSMLRGRPFLPAYIGFHDDGERPVLAIEDLSGERWPPPWDATAVEAVLVTLGEVAATPPPRGLPAADDEHLGLRRSWSDVERDPDPFLAVGICSTGWLATHLPALRDAAEGAALGGDALLHFDVRSDNLCVRDSRAVLVDWNWTSIGNPILDVAFWLPSLHAEGGPAPEDVLATTDEIAGIAAAFAGYLCAHAGREPIPTAPRVREVQTMQARTALPWAARALGLPPPT